MISETMQKRKPLGYKVVMAKIPREDFTRFQHYCDMNEETTNSALKNMILSVIDKPKLAKIAGKSVFVYNKNRDNFEWKVDSDEGTVYEIEDNLPASSLEQLSEATCKAIEERNSFIKKSKNDSVSIPSKFLRDKK